MADRAEVLAEAYRRGLLPPAQKTAYEEAQRRGLIQKPKPSMGQDFMRPIKGAWDGLKTTVKEDYDRAQRVASGKEKANPLSLGPERAVGNLFQMAMSPVQGVIDAGVARPAARAAIGAGLPVYEQTNPFQIPKAPPKRVYGEQAEAQVAGDVGMAISGARAPGTVTRPIPAAPRPAPAAPPPPRMKPTDLKAAKTKAYQDVEALGVQYKPDTFNGLINVLETEMKAANFDPLLHPGPAGVLRQVQKMQGKSPSLTEVDQLRQFVRANAISGKGEGEARIGQLMLRQIDDFMDVAGPKQVVSGDPKAAAAGIKQARDLNTRFRKVEGIEDAVESARLRAGSTGSGGNVDNATRQNLRRVLEDGTWTPDEAKALEEIVVGGKAQNFLRLVGKLSPQGNGLMTALNIGGAAANPLLAIPGMTGVIAKMSADAMTAKKVQQLLELIAGGPKPVAARTPLRVPSVRPVAAGSTAANLFAPRETSRPVPAGR
jgi:hypothetical protein